MSKTMTVTNRRDVELQEATTHCGKECDIEQGLAYITVTCIVCGKVTEYTLPEWFNLVRA